MIECLPSKYKTLSSNPKTARKKKKKPYYTFYFHSKSFIQLLLTICYVPGTVLGRGDTRTNQRPCLCDIYILLKETDSTNKHIDKQYHIR
jgi:hypothetical protein